MSSPIVLAVATLQTACSRLLAFGAHRSANHLVHHVLIERGEGRVILAMTDLERALIFCHLPAPLPLTDFQRKIAAAKWKTEALRFLVPLPDLREAARKANGTVAIAPGELRCGPMPIAHFAAPDVNEFPNILPPLDTLTVGWTSLVLQTGRIDPAALAAEEN
ncbi:MAG: hypothetical protein QOE70_2110 [Chthoniobacter sp.]|jgi:hypothetical protein|nr:hypothetical protein [Chthoniobacter sp.]